MDPQVDSGTRNVVLRATLKNAARKLLPGMYANVSIEVGAPVRYLTLPQTAVAYNPYGATVYIVAPQSADTKGAPVASAAAKASQAGGLIAKQVFVTTGPTRGDQVAIVKGIREGDEVVTSGQIKLRNGALITINNSVQPSEDPNPHPKEE